MTPELTLALQQLKLVTDALVGLIAVVGIPVSVALFLREWRKDRRAREEAAFDALDNKYVDFLRLNLEHPELRVAPLRMPAGQGASIEARKRHLAYLVLLSMLERAHVMYRRTSDAIRREQWKGWQDYLRELAGDELFREAWHLHKDQFDQRFVDEAGALDARLGAAGAANGTVLPSIGAMSLRMTDRGASAIATRPLSPGTVLATLRGTVLPAPTQHSLQVAANVHVDSSGDLDDFMNHSCEPNAYFDFATFRICSLREVAPGEELTLNYCATEWELRVPFSCECGSNACYGEVRGYRYLSTEQRERLGTLASPFLRGVVADGAHSARRT